jgi:hypothetical protein
MYDALPRPPGQKPTPPSGNDRGSGAAAPPSGGKTRRPIVLTTFGRRDTGPRYRGAAMFSLVAHVAVVGLVLFLNRAVVMEKLAPVAVVFRRPPPPPPAPEQPQPVKKGGGRGVALPKAVHPEIQSEFEISLASNIDPSDTGPTGNWLGGSSRGAGGAGWADGLESGTAIKHSLARDPLEMNSAWDCEFPEDVKEGRVVVRIRVHVSATGSPVRVNIVRSGPPSFNASAIECARRQLFHPALDVEGKPRAGDREVSILFYRMGSDEAYGVGAVASPAHAAPSERTPLPGGPIPDLPVKLDDSQPAENPSISSSSAG